MSKHNYYCPRCRRTDSNVITWEEFGCCYQCAIAWKFTETRLTQTSYHRTHKLIDYGATLDDAINEAQWTEDQLETFGLNGIEGLFLDPDDR